MYSFGHQDAYPREEPYCQTYSYDANWEGNQNQFYDQPYYQDDHYYESYQDQSQQHQFYDSQPYQDGHYYEDYQNYSQQQQSHDHHLWTSDRGNPKDKRSVHDPYLADRTKDIAELTNAVKMLAAEIKNLKKDSSMQSSVDANFVERTSHGNQYNNQPQQQQSQNSWHYNYQQQPQDTGELSRIESMLTGFMAEQSRRAQERQARLDNIIGTVEQLPIQQRILKDQLEAQAIATTDECRDEDIEMVMANHQEVEIYEAYTSSVLSPIHVEDDRDKRMLSKPEQLVCEDGFEAFSTVAKAYIELEDDEFYTDDVSEYEDTSPSTTTASPGHLAEHTEETIIPPVPLDAEEPSKDHTYEDFVDVYLSSIEEDPRIRLNTIVKGNSEVYALEILSKEYKGSVLAGANSEYIYLDTQPPDKFRQFLPYVLKLLLGGFYSPLVLKGLEFLKGLHALLNVHVKLDGRKFQWDLKVD